MNTKTLSPWGVMVATILTAQLIVLPVQAAKRSVAVVPVFTGKVGAKEQLPLSDALKSELKEKYKAQIIEDQKMIDYFAQEVVGEVVESEGDTYYTEAKQSYLQFDNKKAERSLQLAIEKYAENPGTQGGLYEAYLLQALMEDEKGQNAKARKSMESAIGYHLNKEELTDSFFSPRFRQMYKTVRAEFVKNSNVTSVKVQLAGDSQASTVYVNGVSMGQGKQFSVLALADEPLYLQAGHQGKLYKTKPVAGKDNSIKIRSQLAKSKNTTGLTYGFSDQTPNLNTEAQWLGQKVGASHVVLLNTVQQKDNFDVGLTVIDAQSGRATDYKNFELADLNADSPRASKLMAQYINGIDKSDYSNKPTESLPILEKDSRKGGSKGTFLAVAGGAILAGVGTALLLGSSSSSGGAEVSTTATAQVGVAPTVLD